jgi:exo-beta-1,3-glucanase (GH17 family)
MIKFKGINYNAGIEYNSSINSNDKIDLKKLKEDLILIKKLNCNTIRTYGSHIDKLIVYSEEMLKQGFNVWISPRLIDGNKKQTIKFIKKSSKEAEKLRKKYRKVVFIIGNELLIDSKAVFDAPNLFNRVDILKSYLNFKSNLKNEVPKLKKIYKSMQKFVEKTDKTIKNFVEILRIETSNNFKGKITYASLPFEEINWNNFNIVGVNLYKNKWNADTYINELRKFKSHGKPVAITEFGTCPYKGSSKTGGSSFNIVDYKTKKIIKGIIRDENEQSKYLKELINMYSKENIFATFIFDFKEEWKTHSKNPSRDLDLSSFGIVKVLKNKKVIPKKAFNIVKKLYK